MAVVEVQTPVVSLSVVDSSGSSVVVVSSVVLVGVPDVMVVKSVVEVVDVVVVDVVVVGSVVVVGRVVVVVVVVEMCGKSPQAYESHGQPFGQFSMHGQLLLSGTFESARHF